jgi:hypothetical protein
LPILNSDANESRATAAASGVVCVCVTMSGKREKSLFLTR